MFHLPQQKVYLNSIHSMRRPLFAVKPIPKNDEGVVQLSSAVHSHARAHITATADGHVLLEVRLEKKHRNKLLEPMNSWEKDASLPLLRRRCSFRYGLP